MSVSVVNMFWSLVFLMTYVTLAVAEREYSVVVSKVEIVEGEEPLFSNFKVKVTKFNRTTAVLNGSLELMQDISDTEIMAKVVTYQKYGTQYQRSIDLPFTSFCEFLENEKNVYPDIVNASNLPDKCPIPKGVKWIKHYLLNEDHLPEKIPPGNHWRVDITITLREAVLVKFRFYLDVQHYSQEMQFPLVSV